MLERYSGGAVQGRGDGADVAFDGGVRFGGVGREQSVVDANRDFVGGKFNSRIFFQQRRSAKGGRWSKTMRPSLKRVPQSQQRPFCLSMILARSRAGR